MKIRIAEEMRNGVSWKGEKYRIGEILEVDTPIPATCRNRYIQTTSWDGFQLQILQITEEAKVLCVLRKEYIEVVVEMPKEEVVNVIQNSTFMNGVCMQPVMVGISKKGIKLFTQNMVEYREWMQERGEKIEERSGKETNMWRTGYVYKDTTENTENTDKKDKDKNTSRIMLGYLPEYLNIKTVKRDTVAITINMNTKVKRGVSCAYTPYPTAETVQGVTKHAVGKLPTMREQEQIINERTAGQIVVKWLCDQALKEPEFRKQLKYAFYLFTYSKTYTVQVLLQMREQASTQPEVNYRISVTGYDNIYTAKTQKECINHLLTLLR